MNIRHFNALPRAAAAYPKIAASLRKKPAREPRLPPMRYIAENLAIDSHNLARYNAVCGYPYDGTVPAVYLAVLAQSLQMYMMTDGGFPFAALGLIHIANRVTQYRPVRAGEILRLSCTLGTLHGHEKGAAFDFVSHAYSGSETVFEGSSTYLARLKNPLPAENSAPDNADTAAENLRVTAEIKAPADIGRRYARISGDYNPIHLYPFTAKMFGFKGQIAHGMWSKARVLAALTLPEAYCAEVRFKLPVFLPAKLSLLTGSPNAGRQDFLLQSAEDGKPHLSGFLQSL